MNILALSEQTRNCLRLLAEKAAMQIGPEMAVCTIEQEYSMFSCRDNCSGTCSGTCMDVCGNCGGECSSNCRGMLELCSLMF